MKTRITLVALVLLAAGCSESENAGTPDVVVNAKAIHVGQSVQGLTRAVVTDGSDVTATVLMCDGEDANWNNFVAVHANTISGEGALTTRANASTASFKAGASAAVTFNPTLYYDNAAQSPKKSHLTAVAPAGSLAASGTTVSINTVDGEQDVMYATAVDAGSASSPAATINLSFAHLTTQLTFEMKMTEASGTGEWDGKTVSVKSIKVQNTQLPQSVNAANGDVTWNTASLLTVPGISNTALATIATKIGNPIMIKAGTIVLLDVTLTVGGNDLQFSNVPIKTGSADLATETGKSHLISLNVTEPVAASGGVGSIEVKATVAPWTVGTSGSGELN